MSILLLSVQFWLHLIWRQWALLKCWYLDWLVHRRTPEGWRLFITILVRTSSLGLYTDGYDIIFLSSSLDIFSTKLRSQEQDNLHSETLYYFLITKEWSSENSLFLSRTTIWNLQMIVDYIILRWFIPFMFVSDNGNYGQPPI
jgi:hypothetical protein